MQRFCASIAMGGILVDPMGKIILQVERNGFCENFSRMAPPFLKAGVAGEDVSTGRLGNNEKSAVDTCDTGLSRASAPIRVEGRQVATLVVGHFLSKAPDREGGKSAAAPKGLPETDDLNARVPWSVLSKNEIQLTRNHVELFSELLGERGRNALQEKRASQKLEKSEDRYQSLINSLPQIVYEIDLNGKLTFANQTAYESFGYTREEVARTDDFLSLISVEGQERDVAHQRLRRVIAGEIIDPIEYSFRRKDASCFSALVFSRPMYLRGKVLGVSGIIIDITERKKMEESLQQNEAMLQSLFRAAPVGLAIIRNRILYALNEELCAILGYEAADLLYQSPRHLYESDEEYSRVGVALYQSLSGQRKSYVETRFCRRDGSLRDVSLFAAPLDPNDPSAGAAVAAQDITEQKRAENALRRSEERFSFAINASSDAVWEMNPLAQTLEYSARWYEMLGYSDQEFPMTFERWRRMCHPADFLGTQKMLQRVYASLSNTGYTSEFRLRHRDGTWVWILSRGKVMRRDLAGFPLLVVGTNTNISKRKLAEEALKVSEERYRTLFEAASISIVIIKNDAVIDCNQKTLEMFRCTRQAIIGQAPSTLFVGQQPDGQSSEVPRGFSEVAQGPIGQLEGLQSRFDGTHFYAEVNLSTFELSGELYAQMRIRDVTTRKNSEKFLRESEFRFRSFYNTNPEGIILVDFQGFVLDANKAFLQESGFSLTEVTHRHFKELVPQAHHPLLQKAIASLQSGISQSEPLEVSYFTKQGVLTPVVIKGWVVTDEKSSPLYLGIFIRDLTKEKTLAVKNVSLEMQVMQAQKNEAIGTLAGGIAHDFNNILGGISGFSQLALLQEPSTLGDKERGYIQRVLEASARAKALVQQILRFSRHNNIEMKSINLTPVIKESIHLLRSTLPTSIEIKQQVDIEDDCIVGDSTQIHQVVMNLGTNAYHAMRETGGRLTVSLERAILAAPKEFMTMKIPPGEYLKLRVMDTGTGMPPSVLQRIFEPYFTTKKVNEGTGLGMAVTLGIIKSHKGLIEIQTAVGQGTSFDVFLPLTQIEPTDSEQDAETLPRGRGERVLIVDDEVFFLEVVEESLRLLGYQVRSSQSSLKTLETFMGDPEGYDLLITDQSMPEMTGAQLAQEIRKISSTLPIILCTGYSETVTEQSASYYGITSFLMKPVNVHDLAKTVHEVLLQGKADSPA